MKIETKEIYKCDFCNKLYQIKHFAIKHENRCYKNPINDRKCFHCSFLETKEEEIYFDDYDGEHSRRVKVFYCKEVDSFLYPPKTEYKNNMFDLGDERNEPMKKNCKFFKTWEI